MDQLISLTFSHGFDGSDRAIDSHVARLRKLTQPSWPPADSDGLRRGLQVRRGRRIMSLRSRILASIVVVIVLTVLITVGVGYYTTQARLGVFVDQIGDDEALQLARNLSREYTAAGGWQTVGQTAVRGGVTSTAEGPREERSEDGDEGHFELLHRDPVRVIIADLDGRVVKDNLFRLPTGTVSTRTGRAPRDGVRPVYDPACGPRVCRCQP